MSQKSVVLRQMSQETKMTQKKDYKSIGKKRCETTTYYVLKCWQQKTVILNIIFTKKQCRKTERANFCGKKIGSYQT